MRHRYGHLLGVIALLLGTATLATEASAQQTQLYFPVDGRNTDYFSSAFGPRELGSDPYDFHAAIDIAAVNGTDVRAVADGIVYHETDSRDSNNEYIYVRHVDDADNTIFWALYLHVEVSDDLNDGDAVNADMVIAEVRDYNNDGASTDHLDLRFFPDPDEPRRDGTFFNARNPGRILSNPDGDGETHMYPGNPLLYNGPPVLLNSDGDAITDEFTGDPVDGAVTPIETLPSGEKVIRVSSRVEDSKLDNSAIYVLMYAEDGSGNTLNEHDLLDTSSPAPGDDESNIVQSSYPNWVDLDGRLNSGDRIVNGNLVRDDGGLSSSVTIDPESFSQTGNYQKVEHRWQLDEDAVASVNGCIAVDVVGLDWIGDQATAEAVTEAGCIDGGGDDDPPGGGGRSLSGSIDADKTLNGGTWTVDDATTVTNGATLTIEPGTRIEFKSGAKITVEPGAKIVAEGTASNPVIFDEANDGQYWRGIIVRGENSRFEHVVIRNAGRGPDNGDRTFEPRPALQVEAGVVKVIDATFSDNAGDAIEARQTPGGQNSILHLFDSTLEGGNFGLLAQNSNLILSNNTIRDNQYVGVHLGAGTYAWVLSNQVKNNGLEGVQVYGGTVDAFQQNTIRNNGQYGLDIADGALIYLDGKSQNRIFSNDYHEVQVGFDSEAYLGDASIDQGGYNEIHDTAEGYGSGRRYVNNQTSWTVPAENNGWSGPNDDPVVSAMFNGPVDYEPYVTPPLSVTVSCARGDGTSVCIAGASGGGGNYDYDWSIDNCDGSFSCSALCGGSSVSVTVTSASGETATASTTTGECLGGGECDIEPTPIICEYPRLSEAEPYSTLDEEALAEEIDAAGATLQSGSGTVPARLHRLYRLLLLEARVEQARAGNRTPQTNAFAGNRSGMHALFAGYAEETAPQGRGRRRARDAARQILVGNLIRSGQPDRALRSARRYAAGMSTKKGRARMHLHRAVAFERKGQFRQALQAVDAAERQCPEGNYASIRMMLLRFSGDPSWINIAEQRKQATSGEAADVSSAPASEAPSAKSLPQAFALKASYPNPTGAGGRVTVPLALPERSEVYAAVYDVLGRRVAVLAERALAAGRPELAFSTEGLSSGLYLIRVEIEAASGETHAFTRKVTVVR